MKTLIANPFKFGESVEGDYYFPRPELSATIRQFLKNQSHTVLVGPGRVGKTSFVLNLLNQFEKEGYCCFLVDIFSITSYRDVFYQLLRSVQANKSLVKSSWMKIVTAYSSLNMDLSRLTNEDAKAAIQDLLDGLANLDCNVIIIVDEFHKIREIDDQGWLESLLRTYFQKAKNVSFLFTGSRKGRISEILDNPSRPLYRSCQTIDCPAFDKKFTEWVIERFATVGIECNKQAINHLRELVQDKPHYVQLVCFHLVAQARSTIDIKDIDESLETVARQNAYAYQMLLDSLTFIQQRVLRLAANESSLFHKESLIKYEIVGSGFPLVNATLNSMKKKEILDEVRPARGTVLFDDPLFALWLRLCFD